jgi:PAS domain S-box-containing protein
MIRAPKPVDERARLDALREYAVLDTAAESAFDELTALAAQICGAPIALISLIDEDRQWFKSRHGLSIVQTERDIAFCAHAILQPETLIVEDALVDVRFAGNPLVTREPGIRFYAGTPLVNPDGYALGTLCILDDKPRKLSDSQAQALHTLGRYVMSQLELRRQGREAQRSRMREDDLRGRVSPQPVAGPDYRFTEKYARDADRARVALLSVLEDQKRVETRLRESELRYRLLFERNPAPMLIYAREGLRLLAVNEAFSRHYGYSQEESRELVLTDLYPNDEQPRIESLVSTLAGYADVGEWHHIKRDGERITIVASSHDTDFQGCAARIAVITDVSARERAEAAVVKLNAELEARVNERTEQLELANRELETFAYTVSHDLKAPLRGIDGYSRLLIEDYHDQLDDEGRLFLDNVRRGAEQMGQLIEDLLAYSRMERRPLQCVKIDIRALLRDVRSERLADIDRCGAVLELPDDIPLLDGDPEGLKIVLRNLLDNALKFSREGLPPRITIRVEETDTSRKLVVADNGIGFDMRFQERIFDIFQRLHRAEEYPGTGIGLAIVRKAMQRMGGNVTAEGEPGAGARFTLEFAK